MNAIRITYNIYFTNDEILIKSSPVHTLSRDFVFKDRESFFKDRFDFENRVHDFRLILSRLYKNVSVDKKIEYFDLSKDEL